LNKKLQAVGLDSQFLHAHKLVFSKAADGLLYLESNCFEAELPKEMLKIHDKLFNN